MAKGSLATFVDDHTNLVDEVLRRHTLDRSRQEKRSLLHPGEDGICSLEYLPILVVIISTRPINLVLAPSRFPDKVLLSCSKQNDANQRHQRMDSVV